MPPAPTSNNGPNRGSSRAPTMISVPSIISCTRNPSSGAPGTASRSPAASASAARATSSGDLRLRRTPPTSVLWLIAAEAILRTQPENQGRQRSLRPPRAKPQAPPCAVWCQSVMFQRCGEGRSFEHLGVTTRRREWRNVASPARSIERERGKRADGLRQSHQIRKADLVLEFHRRSLNRKIHAHEGDHRLVGALRYAAQERRVARALAARQRAAPGQHVDRGVGRDGAAELG